MQRKCWYLVDHACINVQSGAAAECQVINMKRVSLDLLAGKTETGQNVYETLPANHLGDDTYQVQVSPALVLGLARDDIIKLSLQNGCFTVIHHSGNICVQIYLLNQLENVSDLLDQLLSEGALFDGISKDILVITYPISRGFSTIEKSVAKIALNLKAQEWFFGNVYDPKDGVTPLEWWA